MPALGAYIFNAQSEEVLPISFSKNMFVLTAVQKWQMYQIISWKKGFWVKIRDMGKEITH
jgi:hypothetical protein